MIYDPSQLERLKELAKNNPIFKEILKHGYFNKNK